MPLTASPAFDVTLNGRVMSIGHQLTIDLPAASMPVYDFSGVVVSVSLSLQNTTDLPDSARDPAGFGTIGGQVVLAGFIRSLGMSAADFFNPDNPNSPLYRSSAINAPVVFSFGVQPAGTAAVELLPKLTGLIVPGGSQVDHTTGEVTLALGDLTGKWTTVPSTAVPVTVSPFNANCTSETVMDAIIRSQEGASSWPAVRAKCVLAVGGRASLAPSTGYGTLVGTSSTMTFAPGVFGTAMTTAGVGGVGSLAAWFFQSPIPGTFFMEWFTNNTVNGFHEVYASDDNTGDAVRVEVTNSGSTHTLRVIAVVGSADQASQTLTIASSDTYIGIALGWAQGTRSLTGTLTTNSGYQSISITVPAARTAASFNRCVAGISNPLVTIEGLQATNETSPLDNSQFVPIAVLDPSLNPITVPPPIDPSTNARDELQTIAAAEYGWFRRDEYGIIRFWNRNTIAGQPVTLPPITTRTQVKTGLTTNLAGADPYNHIQVPYTEWTFKAPTAVFTLGSVKKIPIGGTTWTQTLDSVAGNLDLTVAVLPSGHLPTDGGSWYRASLDQYGNGQHPGVTFTVTPVSSRSVRIHADPGNQTAYLTTDTSYTDLTAGTAGTGLWIGGTPAIPGDQQLVDLTADAGDKKLTLDANPYRQDADAAASVGSYLLEQLHISIRDFEDIPIVPDSRVQVADRKHLQDPDRSFIDEYLAIWAWTFDAEFPPAGQDGGTWEMTISGRALSPPGAVLVGVAGRSEVAAGSGPGGTFYVY